LLLAIGHWFRGTGTSFPSSSTLALYVYRGPNVLSEAVKGLFKYFQFPTY
jgi:hypothetical protein